MCAFNYLNIHFESIGLALGPSDIIMVHVLAIGSMHHSSMFTKTV